MKTKVLLLLLVSIFMFSTVLFGQTAVEPGGLNPDSGMNKGSADNPYETTN